jgi:cystathionine beta-lyase/cystathionine gamma-synthase
LFSPPWSVKIDAVLITRLLLSDELDQLKYLLAGGARMIFFETPGNPIPKSFAITVIAEKWVGHAIEFIGE